MHHTPYTIHYTHHFQETNKDFHYNSSVTFFYDSFYIRLFDIHPMSRQLFKGGMRSQGEYIYGVW
ncbi:hypothetical protein EON63_02445 [archaeon]|nr:MAG: hypothetical protein EON63_02445 [archaeon]